MAISKYRVLVHALSHLGIQANETAERTKRIVLSNQIVLLGAVTCVPFFFLYRFLDIAFFSWLTLSSMAVCFFILWLNRKGFLGFSRLLLITYSCLAILASVFAFGRLSGLHLFLLPLGWMALVLFDWQEKKSIAYGIALAAIPLLAFELLGSDQGYFYTLTPEQAWLMRFCVLSLTLVGQILEVFYFYQANRRTEEALSKASEVAKAADRAKSQFLANMSHEIRTPLNGILGMSSQLLKAPLRTEQNDMVKTIHKSGLDLMIIISEILDMSKIEAGKMHLEKIPFDPHETIDSVFNQFKFEARRKLVDFSLELPSNLEANLMGDPIRIKQVLNNILSNALKFTDSGKISLKVWGLPLTQSGTPAESSIQLRFEIEDTGIGIPLEHQNKVFKSFTHTDDSILKNFGGTGLGLYISKQIVEMMGGTIEFKSLPGQGSTFSFEIPFALAPNNEGSQIEPIIPKESSSPPASLKILIVEDHLLNQKVLEGFLAQYGCQVDSVGGGREALDAFAHQPYNLILMDCHMPGMDGFECTRRLRSLQIKGKKPIIIGVTADAMVGTRDKCLQAGMDDVLTKPILSTELNRILAKWGAVSEMNVATSAQSQASNSDWVDTEHLRQMNEWIQAYDPNFWERTMAHFRDSSDRLITSMQTDGTAGKLHKLGESAHALKGLCLMMGLSRISNTCKLLENDQPTQSDWQSHISDLKKFLEPSLSELNKYLQRS